MTLHMLQACVAYPTYEEVTLTRRPVEKPTSLLENGHCQTLFSVQRSVQNDAPRLFLIQRVLIRS